MKKTTVPDITSTELWVVETTVKERFGAGVIEVQMADSDLRLDPADRETTSCPTLYWTDGTAHFVIFKVGDGLYRSQFFYSKREQYGTGRREYDDLAECVLLLLKMEADHRSKRDAQIQ
jgi:hypothetical protein